MGKRNALQKQVSRTNHSFPGLVTFDNGRYRIGDGIKVDLWDLESAVASASPKSIASVLDGITNFSPFAGCADSVEVASAVERATVLATAGWERIAAAVDVDYLSNLERGILHAANDELLNERLVTSTAAAMYRLGRQDVGLALLGRCRRKLRDELGIDPGIEFDRVEQAILRHDPLLADRAGDEPTPEFSMTAATVLEAPTPSFAGRTAEIEELMGLVRSAGNGQRGHTVVIEGAGGMGKTELVRSLATLAAAEGVFVRSGSGTTKELLAYEPFVGAIPELEIHLAEVAASPDPAVARLVFWREVNRQLAEVAADGNVLLILEDLHEADSQSAMLLRYLSGGLPPGVMIAATTRPPETGSMWGEVHAGFHMSALGGAPISIIELAPLVSSAVSDLARDHFSQSNPAQVEGFAQQLEVVSGGNPLVCQSICRSLDRPLDLTTSRWGHSPEMAFISSLNARVESDVAEVLGVAGMIGLEFSIARVAELTTYTESDVLRLVERASRAGVVHEKQSAGTFAFDHILTRDAFVEGLSRTRRSILALALLETDAAPASRVRWVGEAADGIDVAHAVEVLRSDQRQLATSLAFSEAVAAGQLAIQMLEHAGQEVPFGLLLENSHFSAKAGDNELARAYRKTAFALAKMEGSVDRMAQVATSGLPEVEDVAGDPDRLEMLLQIDHEQFVDFSRAWFVRCLFRTAWLCNRHDICHRVMRTFGNDDFAGDLAGRARFRADVLVFRGQVGEQTLGSRDFEDLLVGVGPGFERAYVRFQGLIHAIIANEPDAVTTLLDEVRAEVAAHGSIRMQWAIRLLWSTVGYAGGRTDAPSPDAAYQFGVQNGITDAFLANGAQRLVMSWMDGSLKETYQEMLFLEGHIPATVGWQAGRALAAVEAGELDDAVRARTSVLHALKQEPASFEAGIAAMILAEATVRAGWKQIADQVLAVLDLHKGRIEVLGLGSVILGPVDGARAAMLHLLGDEGAQETRLLAQQQQRESGLLESVSFFRVV